MGRYSPWRHLRSLTHIDLTFTTDESILAGADARYYHTVRRIVMDERLTQVERRSVLVHELGHVMRGDLPCGSDRLDERQEQVVDQWAARQLIPLEALGDALRWSDDEHEVADELWVTVELVRVRVAHLHPSERASLRRALEGTQTRSSGFTEPPTGGKITNSGYARGVAGRPENPWGNDDV